MFQFLKPLGRIYEPVGKPLRSGRSYDPPVFASNPSLLIGLACSGGGSRAAYLAAAVLHEICRANLRAESSDSPSREGSLLDQIDFVSSVSGGSLAAAYFVLNKEALRADSENSAWNTYLDKMAHSYRPSQWYRKAALNPWTWIKVLLTN